ncbi:hypothetical protein [Microvirga sp. G4-2]|uniref:hypothetical protein n=1 Tax=Microvirga sp. G4-2 TaxID=3434467 RepID=UPI004044453B
MNLIAAIVNLRSRWAAARELDLLDAGEIDALSRDVGVSTERLKQVASYGDAAGGELPRFMRALNLAPERIERRYGNVIRSMSITCSICAKTHHCQRDLDRGQTVAVKSYCPNLDIIEALKSATCR